MKTIWSRNRHDGRALIAALGGRGQWILVSWEAVYDFLVFISIKQSIAINYSFITILMTFQGPYSFLSNLFSNRKWWEVWKQGSEQTGRNWISDAITACILLLCERSSVWRHALPLPAAGKPEIQVFASSPLFIVALIDGILKSVQLALSPMTIICSKKKCVCVCVCECVCP